LFYSLLIQCLLRLLKNQRARPLQGLGFVAHTAAPFINPAPTKTALVIAAYSASSRHRSKTRMAEAGSIATATGAGLGTTGAGVGAGVTGLGFIDDGFAGASNGIARIALCCFSLSGRSPFNMLFK